MKYNLSNSLEGDLGDNIMGSDSMGLMDLQCKLNEANNSHLDHTMHESEKERMEDCIATDEEGDHIVLVESLEEKQLNLPTSPLPEYHG